MARGSTNGAVNPPPFQHGIMDGPNTVISERDRVVLRRCTARGRRGGVLPRPRRTTLAFGITQVILGLMIVAVSFTAFALSTSNRVRNACPYWAGFSVLFTGGVGLIAWKQPSSLAISFFTFLSALCVVLHLVATALSGLSCSELQLLSGCQRHPGTLVCYCCTSHLPCTPNENAISIEGVRDCSTITSTIRLVMFVICVANIVACLICIAATVVGCAYIVKRHASRRMLLRRPHNAGSIARDSYISDIAAGIIDPIFTPPLVPPPPYSPPEYTEISNDPVVVEGPDYLDDLSTPTPVMPIAPHEMPPPYSTLNIPPGTTIECSVAQEFQLANSEIPEAYDNRLQVNNARDSFHGNGYLPTNHILNSQQVPLPPLRWDSHNVTLNIAQTAILPNGSVSIPNGEASGHSTSSGRRRHRNRRRRSPGDGRSGDSDQSGRRQRNQSRHTASNTLPLPGYSAMGMQPPDRTSACLDERQPPFHERIVTGASCEMIVPNAGETTSWAPPTNRSSNRGENHVIEGGVNGNIDNTMEVQNNGVTSINGSNLSKDLCNGNVRLTGNHELNTGSNTASPVQNNAHQSEHSHSGSSERLTGGTGSSSSRNTRTSSSAQRRQRRRRSSDRRMRTSSSTYSTSSTDHSSKSNGGIRQTSRARQQQMFSTSSSSDSDDTTPHRPPRRLVAKMVNGSVQHEIEEQQGQNVQASGPSRPRKHRSGSRHRQRPLSAQPTVGRQASPLQSPQSNADSKPNTRPGVAHDRILATHGLAPGCIQINQQGRVKQKRPDSLDLKLIWSSHRGYLGHSSLSTSSSADSYDPWIPRDGVMFGVNSEKLSVNIPGGETASTTKVPQTAPVCVKKKPVHRMSKNQHSRDCIPKQLQQPDNDARVQIGPSCERAPLAEVEIPCCNTDRDHVTPEKDIDTTECGSVSEQKQRPKSMVELNKDTTILVSEILSHVDADISPAVKTVLQDIQSVIQSDDRYLAEIWQSACILDKFGAKSSHTGNTSRQRGSGEANVARYKDNRDRENAEVATVSKAEQLKFRHSCPDVDDMQRQAGKMLNVSRAELVKSLEDSRETIL